MNLNLHPTESHVATRQWLCNSLEYLGINTALDNKHLAGGEPWVSKDMQKWNGGIWSDCSKGRRVKLGDLNRHWHKHRTFWQVGSKHHGVEINKDFIKQNVRQTLHFTRQNSQSIWIVSYFFYLESWQYMSLHCFFVFFLILSSFANHNVTCIYHNTVYHDVVLHIMGVFCGFNVWSVVDLCDFFFALCTMCNIMSWQPWDIVIYNCSIYTRKNIN